MNSWMTTQRHVNFIWNELGWEELSSEEGKKKFIKELIMLDLSQYNKDKSLNNETANKSDDSSGLSGDDTEQSDSEE